MTDLEIIFSLLIATGKTREVIQCMTKLIRQKPPFIIAIDEQGSLELKHQPHRCEQDVPIHKGIIAH